MGLWMTAEDRIIVSPAVDDHLIKEFVIFSDISCPKSYCREKFGNPWFFDEENRLICHAGKFAEPPIWYKHLRKYFFRPYGYYLPDYIHIVGEGEPGYETIERLRNEEYLKWRERISSMDIDTIYDTKYNDPNRSFYV